MVKCSINNVQWGLNSSFPTRVVRESFMNSEFKMGRFVCLKFPPGAETEEGIQRKEMTWAKQNKTTIKTTGKVEGGCKSNPNMGLSAQILSWKR